MKEKSAGDYDQKDRDLLSVFKMVDHIYFEYSSDEDFDVKVFILKLIVHNEKEMRHLKKIEFDYVKSAEEMQ